MQTFGFDRSGRIRKRPLNRGPTSALGWAIAATMGYPRPPPPNGSTNESPANARMSNFTTHRSDRPPADLPAGTVMPRLGGHRPSWIDAVATGLGQTPHVLTAVDDGRVVGCLPMTLVRGPIFGRFLVGLPYINTGGVCADDAAVAAGLIDAACDWADELDVNYLELRHERPIDHPRLNADRTDKLHLRLALPPDADAMMGGLKSKVRSQVKKSLREEFEVQWGGHERLDDFYRVFAHNMRDLGTPVFPRRLFASILDRMGDDAELCVLTRGGRPAAAAMLVHDGTMTEVPSASCIRRYNRLNANMRMYWHLIERAIERGSETFDFGRSSEGSGTYRFKRQWGAQPSEATWQYYVRRGDPAQMRVDDGGKRRLIEVWKRMPIWLTRIIGPPIVRGIP